MAAEGQTGDGGGRQSPGGGTAAQAEGVPARGARRVWGRAVAGTLSAIGLAAASLSLALVLAVPGGPAGATGSGANAKTVKISTAKVAGVGTVLTTASGLTLYRFGEDSPGTSKCTGACAKIWPPLLAAKGAHVSGPHGVKGLSLLKVANGHWQVAFHKLPLYTFAADKKKGQAHGQNVGKVWFAVLKSGIPASATVNAAPVTSTTAPATSTTAPATSTTQAPSSSATSGATSGATAPTQAPVPVTSPPTQPSPPPTTRPTQPPKPPPTTTTTAPPITGGTGF
jgi:predicted lipoprotein with Yx(FWY)xxD motif